MLWELSSDQELFRETTERYLREQVPVAELRRRRNDPDGFDADYWRRGADLGWTSLLASEDHGGGTISGDGLADLTLVAHELGRHAAPGPLVPVNVVASALSRASASAGTGIGGRSGAGGAGAGTSAGGDENGGGTSARTEAGAHGGADAGGGTGAGVRGGAGMGPGVDAGDGDAHGRVVAELVAGTATAAWCLAEPRPNDRLGVVTAEVRVDGGDVVVSGVKRPVESAAQATYLLVTGRTGTGLTQVLVPADAPGVSIAPMHTVDLTRRFSVVTFDDVRVPATQVVGEVGGADAEVEHQLQLAVVVSCAEAVGAMQAAFDMTVEWAFDRYSFGRPLASYQALKHRFADMKSWLEASHAITDAAAAAVSVGSPDAAELVSAAKAFVGDYGSELLQDCVQIHGGIGVTFEHDLHLFLRRHTVNRALYGTPAEHRQRLADLAEQRADAA